MKTAAITSLSVDCLSFDNLGRAIIDDEALLEAIAAGAGAAGSASPDINGCGCDGGTCNAYECN